MDNDCDGETDEGCDDDDTDDTADDCECNAGGSNHAVAGMAALIALLGLIRRRIG